MSWTIRRRRVTKFRPKRALFDSYRFPDTSAKPLTAYARTHKTDKYSHKIRGRARRQTFQVRDNGGTTQ
ncbi:hypothetical protein ALC56_15169 [Trachymyrmex septentrionalis]|uniref:Uncharacterized protein n=1 Tax=Trachymyrmex septentrionalis TaxID=34720 RepID=A0A195EQI4_9HYME|nr:hypothetical protein ALC56_15169 [Trachymyrmex septentrionalis]